MKSNWQYLLLAFVLAVFSWYLVSGREKVDTWIQMPVEMVNAPQGYVVRQGLVSRIEVRVRGPRPMVRGIDMKNVYYPLNLSQLQPGLNVLDFDTAQIPLSRAIEVMEIVPPRVELLVDVLQSKSVVVEEEHEVQLHEDYELKWKTITPETVTIRGPQAVVEPIEVIRTQTIKVHGDRPQKWEVTTGLLLPGEVEATPPRVNVQLFFGEKVEEKWVKAEVRIPEMKGRTAKVKPEAVRLLLEMPVSMAREKLSPEQFWVVPEELGLLEQGVHRLGYRVAIPPGSFLLQAEPEWIEVVIVDQEQ